MSFPCAKQRVVCLATVDGALCVGENQVINFVLRCPRDRAGFASGQGYHLCL